MLTVCLRVAVAVLPLTLIAASAHASAFRVLYTFNGAADGSYPSALIAVDGALVGTTEFGGTGTCENEPGCGTIYRVTPQGKESVLFSFPGPTDGAPFQSLHLALGHLYGLENGVTHNMFDFDLATGAEALISAPANTAYGSDLRGSPIDAGGPLAVVAYDGGKMKRVPFGAGTIVEFRKSPLEKSTRALYRFKGAGDGASPYGGLINVSGTIYGTTNAGGRDNGGTLFSLTLAGVKTTLYDFARIPTFFLNSFSRLTYANGLFYGTITHIGRHAQNAELFSIDMAGNKTTLATFDDGSDLPTTDLIFVNGEIYGCTARSIFSVTTAGVLTVVHSFAKDQFPTTTPVYLGGALYGAATGPGSLSQGFIYKFDP